MQTLNELITKAQTEKYNVLSLLDLDELPDELPDELFNLIDLEELNLGNFIVKEWPLNLLKLGRLKKLAIGNLNLNEFPGEILSLKSLTHLTINDCGFNYLPAILDSWEKLEYLNLHGCSSINSIKGLPPNLSYLNISGHSYNDWPEKVSSLKQLMKLVIVGLNLRTIPKDIFNIRNLFSLYAGDNSLSEIPVEILNFKYLEEINLNGNLFLEFPEILTQLPNLQEISLNGNQINKLPNSFQNLKQLTRLELGLNAFNAFPEIIFQMSTLNRISFANYEFYSNRDSSANSITHIPEEILSLTNLKELKLHGNPIENIPAEILDKEFASIKNFLQEKLSADKEEYLYEAKMVVVGRGNVGKTVLTRKLSDPNYTLADSETTKGINILKNPFNIQLDNMHNNGLFKFNIWDFGGQEKYDATHQLFITNRSIYLFLTEAREESNYLDFYYWLNTISLFSNNSPVIVVLSKYDERRKLIPESVYKEKFKNIIRFVDVSCATEYSHTIENLIDSIKDAINLLPQTKQKLSNRWVDIRNEIQKLSSEKDYISYTEYLSLCMSNGLDKVRADFLSQYLNDLGVIIHHQNDLLLRKTVFINTEWCVDGIYKVLDSEEVFNNSGKFTNNHLSQLWDETRFEEKQAELLKLMHEYKLCFELRDGSGFIAPDLLRPDRSQQFSWNYLNNLQFEYRYDFMPAGILTRFIVKSHSIIKDKIFWKYGVVLKYETTEALIEEDYIHNKVKISVTGSNKKGMLSAVRMYMDEVHRDFDKSDKLIYEEMIPCNCSECATCLSPHFYKYKVLKKFEANLIKETFCENSSEPVEISSLINGVEISRLGDKIETDDDLRLFIFDVVTRVLEHDITHKGGYINFWRDINCHDPKNETEIQPYVANTIDHYCKTHGIQLSREVYESNGSVDIHFSFTNKERKLLKVCLELKKAHHSHIESAIQTQLPAYMESAMTESGIYLVFWFKNEKMNKPVKYDTITDLQSAINQNNPNHSKILSKIINVNKRTSPSKLKSK